MIENALIDGDLVCYRCAASAEDDHQEVAEVRADELIRRILKELNAVGHKIFLTGESNFRYEIYPEYKANRKDQKRPRHLQAVREHLCRYWDAKVTDGIEADDALGIEQCSVHIGSTCIASLDKDMRMIPGYHYTWEIQGTSSTGKVWVRDAELLFVSPLEGLLHHYYQAILGDPADNIFGYDGKARAKVPQFMYPLIDGLHELKEEKDMYKYVLELYQGDKKRLDMNLSCLYILQKENQFWKPPLDEEENLSTEIQIEA